MSKQFGALTVERGDIRVSHYYSFTLDPIDKKDALSCQVRGCRLLSGLGIKHWISSGNLLGLYRDRQFLPHDTDIDVNIAIRWDTDETNSLFKHLLLNAESEGFAIVRSVMLHNHPMQLAWLDRETDIIFDVYPFYTGLEEGYALNLTRSGLIRKPLKFLDLSELEYGGYTFPIPGETEEYFQWRFGSDWREPKRSKVAWEDEATHLEVW